MVRITKGDLIDAIREYGKEKPKRPVGKGWHTIAEMAKAEGIACGTLDRRLRVAIQNGLKFERFIGSDYDVTGRLVKRTWYR